MNETREDRLDFMRQLLYDATRLKKVMLKKKLRVAKAQCPRCSGFLYGSLNGNRDHLHMRCNGPCERVFIE